MSVGGARGGSSDRDSQQVAAELGRRRTADIAVRPSRNVVVGCMGRSRSTTLADNRTTLATVAKSRQPLRRKRVAR